MGNLSGGGRTARAFPGVVVLNIKRKYKRNAWQFISADCHGAVERWLTFIMRRQMTRCDVSACLYNRVRAQWRPAINLSRGNVTHQLCLPSATFSSSSSFSSFSFYLFSLCFLPSFLPSFPLYLYSMRHRIGKSIVLRRGYKYVHEGFCNTYDAKWVMEPRVFPRDTIDATIRPPRQLYRTIMVNNVR